MFNSQQHFDPNNSLITSGLLFYGVEAVQRRPVSPQVQDWAYRSGLALLMTVMLLVTFNDLSSFGLWQSLSGLIG